MYKKYFVLLMVFIGILNAKYINLDKIDKNKKSLQVSSCEDRTCINKTHHIVKDYDHTTVIEDGYYTTYLVNIDKESEDSIMSSLKDQFPDMILRKKYIDNKELYSLKAYEDDFYINKDFKTKIKTKSANLYSKPIHTSLLVEKKYLGDSLDIDGCNEYDWCKQKDKESYLALYRIELLEKIEPEKQKIIIQEPKKQETFDTKTFVGKYKLALKYFKEKKYEEAYKLLEELFNQKSDDLNINFYLGRSAYETKRYDEAITAYERFLFEKPDNNRVKIEMARSLYMNKSYKEANKLLLEVKQDPNLPEKTLVVVEIYLKLIDEKISKHFISGILMAGVYYDSNINSRSKYDTFSNVYFSSFDTYLDITNTTEDATALYNQEVALINYYYKIDDTRKLKQDFMVYNKDSFSSSYNTTDVLLLSYTPAFSIQYDKKLSVDYSLYTDLMWYGNQKYLKTIAIYPKLTYVYDEKNTINTYFKYQSKFYQQSRYSYKDSYYGELGLSLMNIYNKKWVLTPSVVITDEEKKSGDTEGIDYSSIKLGLASTYIYKPTLTFAPSITYNLSRYEGQDSSYLVQQLDREFKMAFSSTYIYSPKWIFQGSADYTYQTSTIQSEEYDKHTLSINVIRPF